MPESPDTSIFAQLSPREKLTETQIETMITEIRDALQEAHALDYFERMELNHDTRHAWWPGQTNDGRKWKNEERAAAFNRFVPGQKPPEVFPWNGSSDVRVRLVEELIREHNTWKRLAMHRRTERVGPRNLSPDRNPQEAAALWGQVSAYYDDVTKHDLRAEIARWTDISHEYGHALLHIGWETENQTVKKTLDAEALQAAVREAAVREAEAVSLADWLSEGGSSENFPGLDAEQAMLVSESAEDRLAEMIADDTLESLVNELRKFDSEMPLDEARRVARSLEWGKPAEYYAVTELAAQPCYRALTYGVDCLFPPTSKNVKAMPWIVMPEWVTEVDLRGRINDPHFPYDEEAVEEVLKHPGKAFAKLDELVGGYASWVLSGGHVRAGVLEDKTKKHEFQILHVYYTACAVGNVRALYHTVLHGQVPGMAIYHECCEHAHGRKPFVSCQTELHAPYLLASRGYGEISFTDQDELKQQRDSCSNNAQIKIKPPIKVPLQLAGGTASADLRPGLKIPSKSGTNSYEKVDVGGDSGDSQLVQQSILDAFNALWFRGAKVDSDVKRAFRDVLVMEFLTSMEAVKEMTFKLVQEFSPRRIRASFFNGLSTPLDASREDIQGQVSIEIDYDVGMMDPELMDKRFKALGQTLQFDNQNLINREPILRATIATLLPAYYKEIVARSEDRQGDETRDEQSILAQILNGTLVDEASTLIPGTNHALRLQIMQRVFGLRADKKGQVIASAPVGADGQASRAQRAFMEDPAVQRLVLNRLKFHAFQITQQENAVTGRLGVEPAEDQNP